jgi:hypothetical protein
MHLKVHDGTPNHSESTLCHTCRWATIVKGRSVGHEIIKCNEIAGRVPFAVASCTEYNDRRMPSRADLEDIAWVLRTDSKTRTIGFVKPDPNRPRVARWDD